MPVYEFKCNNCLNTFEELLTTSQTKESDINVFCPVCHSLNVTKLISLSSFHLKGPGWAKDNYSKVTK